MRPDSTQRLIVAVLTPVRPAASCSVIRIRSFSPLADSGYSPKDLTVLAAKNVPFRIDAALRHQCGKWFGDWIEQLYGENAKEPDERVSPS